MGKPTVFSDVIILELHGGEGGDDSKLFVADLFQAYLKYANSNALKCEVLQNEHGHVVFKITGKGAWDKFKNEPGKHIIQRVPPTERNGRRQTSVLTVAVLNAPQENKEESLKEQDLEITFQTGKQKAGGQNVNRVKSACRMVHKPTGLSVFINGRDQGVNRREALETLTKRINDQKRSKNEKEYNSTRKNQMLGDGDKVGGRGNKVRTYNFIRGEIEDHNLNRTTKDVKSFMKGDFKVLFGN